MINNLAVNEKSNPSKKRIEFESIKKSDRCQRQTVAFPV